MEDGLRIERRRSPRESVEDTKLSTNQQHTLSGSIHF
jgi:hypothetical protein